MRRANPLEGKRNARNQSTGDASRRHEATPHLGDKLGDRMTGNLTALQIKRASDGKIEAGGGLQLRKKGQTGQWVFRYSHLGRRREMGLGPWPIVSLADARKLRDEWAAELAAGRDPITSRNERRAAEIAERDKHDPTFAELAEIVFEARKAGLRADGERGRWMSPIRMHMIPKIGKKRVSQLGRIEVSEALRPIWRKMPPTANKAFQRTKLIFREGRFMGFACDPLEVDAAARILGEVRHFPVPITSTRWQDLPALYARLGNATSDDCLRLLILTCVRADAAKGARRSEISNGIWTIPKDRVKGAEGRVQDFRVPLSEAAQRVIEGRGEPDDDLMFTARRGRPISTNALEKRLNEMGEAGRPHGFRTTFRTWVQDTDACSWEVAETVLGHQIGNRIERSYARSDLLERRRIVMEAWSAHVTGAAKNVVQIVARRAQEGS